MTGQSRDSRGRIVDVFLIPRTQFLQVLDFFFLHLTPRTHDINHAVPSARKVGMEQDGFWLAIWITRFAHHHVSFTRAAAVKFHAQSAEFDRRRALFHDTLARAGIKDLHRATVDR